MNEFMDIPIQEGFVEEKSSSNYFQENLIQNNKAKQVILNEDKSSKEDLFILNG